MAETHHLGQRLSYDGALCTVRYIGDVVGTTGTWLGVEWDDPSRGKHDGHHKGVRYFDCLSRSRSAASFVRPSRRADKPQSFVAALLEKYATAPIGDGSNVTSPSRNPEIDIIFFGKKVAEEVGFDKIRRQLSKVEDLRIVILDGMRIAWDVMFEDGGRGVKDTSPLIFELDLSRNLFESFGTVVRICRELEGLKSLRLNGNRFQIIHPESEPTARSALEAFKEVRELELEETLLSWESICEIASNFPVLDRLSGSLNHFTSIPEAKLSTLVSTLTTVDLEYNEFTSLADIAPLASLKALRILHLKGNSISAIRTHPDAPPPIFAPSLTYIDVSYNAISSWSFIDALPTSAPSLTALRLSNNPLWANPVPGAARPAGDDHDAAARTTDEAHMITTARLPSLKTLNFATVTPQDRTNAELFYLSRIAKQLAAAPEEDEARVLEQHPLYAALCAAYGEPDIVRRDEVDPSFLEARLVRVLFVPGAGVAAQKTETEMEIPKSFDVYAVKAIAGRMFAVPPLAIRLVWETGEWDPVGGFDEELGDSSDEEDEGLEADLAVELEAAKGFGEDVELRKGGRWVKREVELADGPRQLGFCVDGLSARIRVETRQ
ncbi:Tubulin-specific chaperone E like protein [Verticillium longisporum]|uniref:Tubulin-specific chaperone E like protein n=1 Tax=Verticillium longisporum TaxID=100787 RepID=A0A8I3AX15_VERLO|nr:Tubulin-specific chaperone E like protein [Verticillium longisporum]